MDIAALDATLESLALEREAERLETLELQSCIAPRELERRGLGLHKLRITSVCLQHPLALQRAKCRRVP